MPPDDTEFAAGQRPITSRPYRGRYYIAPDGSVEVWNGETYVPRTASTLAPDATSALERERTELSRLNDATAQGRQFLQLNQRQATGSLLRRIPVLSDLGEALSPGLQQMENIQNSRVFDYMRGGAAGGGISAQAANTPQEQRRLERTGPTIQNTGPVNRAIVLETMVARDLQTERLNALEAWARDPRRRSLEGFEQWWTANMPRIRDSIQGRYEATNGPISAQADAFGRQRPNPPQRPASVPADAEWNPDTRTWVRRR